MERKQQYDAESNSYLWRAAPQWRRQAGENLRLDGVVITEDDIYRAMDVELSGKSNVLPISVNKDGTVRKSDKAVDKEEFRLIADYASDRIAEAGNAIL